MRISDWSSDVCSSDLVGLLRGGGAVEIVPVADAGEIVAEVQKSVRAERRRFAALSGGLRQAQPERGGSGFRHTSVSSLASAAASRQSFTASSEIGRASCRESVCPYV